MRWAREGEKRVSDRMGRSGLGETVWTMRREGSGGGVAGWRWV